MLRAIIALAIITFTLTPTAQADEATSTAVDKPVTVAEVQAILERELIAARQDELKLIGAKIPKLEARLDTLSETCATSVADYRASKPEVEAATQLVNSTEGEAQAMYKYVVTVQSALMTTAVKDGGNAARSYVATTDELKALRARESEIRKEISNATASKTSQRYSLIGEPPAALVGSPFDQSGALLAPNHRGGLGQQTKVVKVKLDVAFKGCPDLSPGDFESDGS